MTKNSIDPGREIAYPSGGFKSWDDFYPFYLGQHQNGVCRLLHVVASVMVISWTVGCGTSPLLTRILGPEAGIGKRLGLWFLGGCFAGYFPAWIGHFIFEKNRPATFKHPFYSLASDFRMSKDILLGNIKLNL